MTNVVVEVQKYLDEYVEEVSQATKAAAKEAAELTAKTLKATSPKKARRGGKYARAWAVKKIDDNGYVVYNGKFPGLTHLLEHGHVVRNQYGGFGRARAIPHIGRAADAGIQRFELSIRARLRK